MSAYLIKPLSDLVSFHTSWISCQTSDMLDELVSHALAQFPISFPNEADAKIYFFVLVNKEILFREDFQITLKGETSVDRREACQAFFNAKKDSWKRAVDKHKIYLGSEVCFVMQGIAHTPGFLNEDWHIPYADSRRDRIGLKPHRGSSNAYRGAKLPNDPELIQNVVSTHLSAYGIQGEHIPNISEVFDK